MTTLTCRVTGDEFLRKAEAIEVNTKGFVMTAEVQELSTGCNASSWPSHAVHAAANRSHAASVAQFPGRSPCAKGRSS